MADNRKVMLVDDEVAMRQAITQWLDLAGFAVQSHDRAQSALTGLTADYDGILVTDLKMEGLDGMGLLGRVAELDPDLPVVMITGHGDIQVAVEAMRLGAYDFIEKPFEPERFLDVVRRASEKRRLVLENRRLRRTVGEAALSSRIIGTSRAAEALRAQVAEIAATDVSVVIYGETGVGKDLVARSLHELSPRRERNYVAINCAAVPESMAEAEFFGHEAGAFTGATRMRQGRIEHAQGGTLFLDEVESMPMSIQGKLLRVLQERQFERLGSNRIIAADFRTIAASKIDLRHAEKGQNSQNTFRPDLYYRLCVAELSVPPLRERRDDIPLLFDYFADISAQTYGRERRPLGSVELNRLMKHDWPGNIRELRNAAERHTLGLDRVKPIAQPETEAPQTLPDQVEQFEREVIERSLVAAGGRIHLVMEQLGLPRRTLTDKMAKYGLDRRQYAGTDKPTDRQGDRQDSATAAVAKGENPPIR